MGYIGMCRFEGYGFQAVYSRIGSGAYQSLLSIVHFKGSAQLTQFCLAEHKLYRVVSWSVIYN